MAYGAVLAGCGDMARGWMRAITESPELGDKVRLLGLVDLNVAAADKLAAEFGLTGLATGSDLETMIATLKPALVFDVIATAGRHALVTTGLRHGCHVLSEKPMAESLADARSMVMAAKAAGRIHAVIQNRRYNPGVRRIRRLIASGAIGDVTAVHCDFFVGAHFGGFRENMDHILLLDMAVHQFDAARFMSGAGPVTVHCYEWNPPNSPFKQGASAIALFEMTDGIVFSFRGSWTTEGLRTSWDSAWRIVGTRGSLTWDGHDDLRAEVKGDRRDERVLFADTPVPVPPHHPSDRADGHRSVIEDFVRAVENRAPPETSGADNIRSIAMVFAAVEAAEKGRSVPVAT